jgi:hypothetical protein
MKVSLTTKDTTTDVNESASLLYQIVFMNKGSGISMCTYKIERSMDRRRCEN